MIAFIARFLQNFHGLWAVSLPTEILSLVGFALCSDENSTTEVRLSQN